LTLPGLDAVVLDMDGLLIDTEPVWRAAEAEVFAGLGVQLSERDLLESTGQPAVGSHPVLAIRRCPTRRSRTGSSTRSGRTCWRTGSRCRG